MRSGILTTLAAVVWLVASASAASINVNHPVTFNGTEVRPGVYKVMYSGSGSDLQVSLLQGKKIVASSPAHFEERDTKAPYDALVTDQSGGGAPAVTQIQLSGKKQALVLGNGGTQANNMGK